MKVLEINNLLFHKYWSFFTEREKLGPFYNWHYIRFLEEAVGDSLLGNFSFIVTDENDPVVVFPIIIERGDYGNQISVKNGPIPYWVWSQRISRKKRKRALEEVQDKLNQLTREYDIVLQKSLVDALSFVNREDHYNILIEQGHLDFSITTRIVNLQESSESLWLGIRKSYKSLINKGMKKFEIIMVDHKNSERDIFFEFVKLYVAAAGKEVYKKSAWEILFNLVEEDKGLLVLIKKKDSFIGGAFFQHENEKVYYSLGANHPVCETNFYIGHVYIWSAIQYYIARKFKYFEVGWQNLYPQVLSKPSSKERSISIFKRGFGGIDMPLFRGVKFYNFDVCKEFIRFNVDNFFKTLK